MPMRCFTKELGLSGWRSNALQDLIGDVARLRGDMHRVLEANRVGDSQSNGLIERALRSVEEMIRARAMVLGEERNSTSVTPHLVG